MNPEDIKDDATLKAWLKGQTREVAITIAHRAAMRVAPSFWLLTSPCRRNPTASALEVCRPCLYAFVVSYSRSSDDGAVLDCIEANRPAVKHQGDPITRGASKAALWALGSAFRGDIGEAARFAAESVGEAQHIANLYNSREFWNALQNDIREVQQPSKHYTLRSRRLWSESDNALPRVWEDVAGTWRAINDPGWQFWADWYDAILVGRPLLGDWDRHWALLTEIALIVPDTWDKGPDAVNPLLAKILEKHRSRADIAAPTPSEEIASAVADAPANSTAQEVVQRAMERNRDAIPHNLDALEAFILLEIERLQHSNHLNAVAPDECARMIRNLATMYEIIQSLRARIPEERPVNDAEAQESEALVRLYWDKLRALPREKADALVEAVWQTGGGVLQGGMIFASTSLAVAYGLPALAGIATGALLFAPDKATAIINAARGAMPKP